MNRKKTTILMICPFAKPNLGGVESHLDKLIKFLTKNNCLIYLLTYQPLTMNIKAPRRESYPNLVIERVSWFGQGWFNKLEGSFPLSFAYLFPGLFVKSLFFYLKNHQKIDCLHAHGLAAAMIARILSKIHKKRIVVSTHAIYNFKSRELLGKIIYWVLRPFDQILAVGEPSRQELIKIGLSLQKIKVHPNWVDTTIFKPRDKVKAKKELGFGPSPLVLFVGRLIDKKGIRLLLAVSRYFNKINFVFVGSGPEEKKIKQEARLRKNVIFVGKLSQDNKKEFQRLLMFYRAATLFVSLPDYEEGFATVYLEAISCGTPVLASNKGCPLYFLKPSVSVLIKPTLTNLKRELKRLFYENKARLFKMTKNCRPYALKNFSEKNAEIIFNSYQL